MPQLNWVFNCIFTTKKKINKIIKKDFTIKSICVLNKNRNKPLNLINKQ